MSQEEEPFWKQTLKETETEIKEDPKEHETYDDVRPSPEKYLDKIDKDSNEENKSKAEEKKISEPLLIVTPPARDSPEPESPIEDPINELIHTKKVAIAIAEDKHEEIEEEHPVTDEEHPVTDEEHSVTDEEHPVTEPDEKSEEEQQVIEDERKDLDEDLSDDLERDHQEDHKIRSYIEGTDPNIPHEQDTHDLDKQGDENENQPAAEDEDERESVGKFGDGNEQYEKQPDYEHHSEEKKQIDDENEIDSNASFTGEDIETKIAMIYNAQYSDHFRNAFEFKYALFRRDMLEHYEKVRFDYLQQMDFNLKEIERENNSVIDYMEIQLDEANHERDLAIKRASESKIILANVLRDKYNTFYLKRACFQAWKHDYEWSNYLANKQKFSDGYYRKKTLQKLFKGWKKISHHQFLQKAFMVRDAYELEKRKQVNDIDNEIDNLLLYLSQLDNLAKYNGIKIAPPPNFTQKIQEETGLILEIPEDFQVSINEGLARLQNETGKLRETQLFDEVRETRQEEIYQN